MSSSVLIASAATSGFAIGFIPTLVDSVRAPLCRQLNVPEPRVERILSLFYLCWLPAMPLSGWLVDQGRTKEVLFFGLLACVLGIAWLGLARSLSFLLTSVLVLGIGYSMVATAGIRLMPVALGFTQLVSTPAALNVGFVFVILGAVAGPWLVSRAERRWGCRQGLLYLSLGVVAAAALVFLVHHDQFPAAEDGTRAWAEVFRDPRLWLMAAVVLLYFAIENCLEVWPEPFLKELGYRDRGLVVAMLIFWAAFTAARIGTGWLPDTYLVPWALLVLVLAAAFIMGNLVGANEYNSGSLGFWLIGACYGPLLPGFLALVMDIFKDVPATALGMMLALGGLDTLIVRPIMTGLSRRRPARSVMRVPMILALVMASPLLVLALVALLR